MTWRFGALVVLLNIACSPAVLVRPTEGNCVQAEGASWSAKARNSLVFAAYRPGKVYDIDRNNRPVDFRIGPLPTDSKAVLSYPDTTRFGGGDAGFAQMRGRSFVYDDALAVLWLTASRDQTTARQVLQSLAALQRPDGAWGFGFQVQGDGFYNMAYVRAGAVAWVVYAFARYQSAFHDNRFAPQLRHGVRWLLSQRDEATGLIFAGSGRWLDNTHFEPEFIANFAATEHQIDAWFALRAAADADAALAAELQPNFVADALAAAIEKKLWMEGDGRYAQGASATGIDGRSALDAAGTWAAVFALANGNPARADDLLRYVNRAHSWTIGGWLGWRPYLSEPPPTWFVEGSIAIPLVQMRLDHHEQAKATFQGFIDLACSAGVPLVYSPGWFEDFPLSPAVAPTVWFLFAASEILEGEPAFLWNETAVLGGKPPAPPAR